MHGQIENPCIIFSRSVPLLVFTRRSSNSLVSGGKSLFLAWQWQKWMSTNILQQTFFNDFRRLEKKLSLWWKSFFNKAKKNFHRLEKILSNLWKIYLSSSELQFAELQTIICKAPNSSLDKGKLVFGYKQIDANRDVPLCRHDGWLGRVQIKLTLLSLRCTMLGQKLRR